MGICICLTFIIIIIGACIQPSAGNIVGEAAETEVEKQKYNYWLLPEYDYISEFIDKYGFLEKEGKTTLVGEDYRFIPSTSEYEVITLYEDLICIKSRDNFKYGLMNSDGTIIIEPKYEFPIEFSEGLAIVSEGNKIGFINADGRLEIDYYYEWGCPFKEGKAAVVRNNQYYFIDTNGNILSGPFDSVGDHAFEYVLAYMEYSEGYTAYFIEDKEAPVGLYGAQGYWGYLDQEGNVAIPAQYLFVRRFSDGYAAVETKNREWIFIDKQGTEIMKGSMADFYNGMVYRDGAFIDKKGNTMLRIPDGYSILMTPQKGYDNFYLGDLIVVYKEDENRYGIMNKEGVILVESETFEEIKIFNDNYVAVKENGKWGIIILKVE